MSGDRETFSISVEVAAGDAAEKISTEALLDELAYRFRYMGASRQADIILRLENERLALS